MVNPFGLCYGTPANLDPYAGPSALVIAGRNNRNDPAFQAIRDAGGEVFAYINVTECPDNGGSGPLDREFYEGVTLWNPRRVNYAGHTLTDLSIGSDWSNRALDRIAAIMSTVDGVFLDVMGARLWSTLAAWDTWPVDERATYVQGRMDFLLRLDLMRRQEDDMKKVVTNGMWEPDATVSSFSLEWARTAIDGVCIEHHPYTRATAISAASRQYSDLGHKRLLWISKVGEAQLVAAIPGVTHVSDQQSYGTPTPPPVPTVDIRAAELGSKIARLNSLIVSQRDAIQTMAHERADMLAQRDIARTAAAQLVEALNA